MMRELLIGKTMCVVQSTNKLLVGLTGVVLDETQYTFLLKTNRGQKRILKRSCVFECEHKVFAGKDIEKTSFERVKQ